MNKFLAFTLSALLSSALMAYSDSDMDGVEDSLDKCPNTPFTDLVNSNGCSIKKLSPKINYHHFDIIVGANYTGSNLVNSPAIDNYSASLQADYYYKDFSLQATTSYYTVDSSDGHNTHGMNDSYVGAAYTLHPIKDLSLRFGAGVLLPTYDNSLNNNKTDYSASVNVSYMLDKVNLFGTYIYTNINDDDVTVYLSDGSSYNILYNDTNAYSLGLGYYFTNSFYLSGAYNQTQSIYKNITTDAKTLSTYIYYGIDKHWFVNLAYAYGISDTASDHAASVKLGYFF